MRILLIDDQQLIRESLEALLQATLPDVSLDHAENTEIALRLARSIDYQVILLDWWLCDKEANGGECLARLRAGGSTARIVVLTGDSRAATARRAMQLGADAVVTKSGGKDAFFEAINAARGPLPAMTAAASIAPVPGVPASRELVDVFPDLSRRQVDVFRLLLCGFSDKQIARELDVEATTVKTHVRVILQTLGAHTRAEAVAMAMRQGGG